MFQLPPFVKFMSITDKINKIEGYFENFFKFLAKNSTFSSHWSVRRTDVFGYYPIIQTLKSNKQFFKLNNWILIF
jgi:hypothetical protein